MIHISYRKFANQCQCPAQNILQLHSVKMDALCFSFSQKCVTVPLECAICSIVKIR